jgi:glycosyltransferase involved in cell wall biosynthesis
MKIQYDHQIFTQQQYGGISRYFYELIKRFDGNEDSCKVATMFSENAYYNKNFNPELNGLLPDFHFKGKGRIMAYFNKKKSLKDVQNADFDVFHPTYYDDYFVNKLRGKPFVVTFYDMIHEKFSSQFESLRSDTKIFDGKKRLLEHSSKIIAISETTKKDIIEIFDVDSSKIDVVYLGNSLQYFDKGDNRLVEEDYILFVGNRTIYKNFIFFVTAIAPLLIDNNLKLICAGGGNFSQEELDLLKRLKVEERVVFKQIVNDDVLANYYSNAVFFCFPSLYEGFGIPVLEAFACGCPALLSTGGSLPEIGADAALYFDPTNPDSLEKVAIKLISDRSLRQSLKEKGYSRLKEFSWDKTFQDHLNVYQSII